MDNKYNKFLRRTDLVTNQLERDRIREQQAATSRSKTIQQQNAKRYADYQRVLRTELEARWFHNVLSTGGGGSTPPANLLLDTYSGAAAAYSLRQLSSTYTGNAIRVRRSSDNAELNIGFVSNVLDTASLFTFVGGGQGYITTWYDQSGNGRNVTQSTATSQPMIMVAGSLVTRGGKPALSFNDPFANLNNSLSNATTGFPVNNVSHLAVSSKRTNGGDLRTIYSTGILAPADGFGLFYNTDEKLYYQARAGAAISGGGAYANVNNTNNLIFGVLQPVTDNHWFNGANNVATSHTRPNANSTNPITIGSNVTPTWNHNGTISEVVFWNANQTTNRTGIETNVNSFYSIY